MAALAPLAGCSSIRFQQDPPYDFGVLAQEMLQENTEVLFGVKQPLPVSIELKHFDRVPGQAATDVVRVAKGLHAEFVTRNAANHADMFVFWPDDNQPTHLIFCIEGLREEILPGKWNPSVQSIDIVTGEVTTHVRGMNRCDGIRRTAWGTLLVTEETDDGAAYEILGPLEKTDVLVRDRQTGDVSHPDYISKRADLPIIAWEGLTVLSNGVVIAGDELRPGETVNDTDGGTIFKFIPEKIMTNSRINTLQESPFAYGTVYALRVDCYPEQHPDFPQYGQGCETGNASWIQVNAESARHDANALGATGYYRPEDLHADPEYKGEGVRFCWANSGNRQAGHNGEIMCAIDGSPLSADPARASVKVERFIQGDDQFNSVDNLAFQPGSGNLYVLEDDRFGEIYACLPDGRDRDHVSDGCIRILVVLDTSAEPTGFEFNGDGTVAYLSIQHSRDSQMPIVDDYPTDDIIRITGFRRPE